MNHALLLLAGNSTRFKNKVKKQFFIYKNKPLFYYPLKSLNDNRNIDDIIVVTNKESVMDVYNFAKVNKFNKLIAVIEGGETRSKSVLNGINKYKELNIDKNDLLLIHDGARVILDQGVINTAINETSKKLATTFAVKSYDTMVNANNYKIINYVDREKVFRLFTPQTFRFDIICEAFDKKNRDTNDDTELVHLINKDVYLLKGNDRLFKVTSFEDIKKLEIYKL